MIIEVKILPNYLSRWGSALLDYSSYISCSPIGFAANTQNTVNNTTSLDELANSLLEDVKDGQNTDNSPPKDQFITTKGHRFYLNNKPYQYMGTNFWQAMNLASNGPGGNRPQLLRELDNLKAHSITNLRIMCASEGPNTEPLRSIPSLQKQPGIYDEDLLDGLDFLLKSMGERGMKAIMVLGNMWHWSGGFGQYLVWSGVADKIPYPPPAEYGNWDQYQRFTSQFYSNPQAVYHYLKHIKFIVKRFNQYTNLFYKDDPTIMAWELANEPRAIEEGSAYHNWISISSYFIKALDRRHLVTTGSEGDTSTPSYSGIDYYKDHLCKNIDYGTAHIWIQNWGWYDPLQPENTYNDAFKLLKTYLDSHIRRTLKLGKPIVIEEFGIARDKNNYNPTASTQWRDKYLKDMFEELYKRAEEGALAGGNFWAWAGESRPLPPYGLWWKKGDPMIGDPPHEQQGWYSVYDTDTSTLSIIREYAEKFNKLFPMD